jgi:hypothetical protein
MTTTFATETANGSFASDGNGRHKDEEKKQERLTLLRERRAIHVRRGQRALLARLLSGETATADYVYESVELPPSIDPRCLGAVPGSLARAGIIRSLGYIKSARPERHASPIQVWTLADRAAAVDWLAANPDYPDLLLGDELPLFAAANKTRPTEATAGRDTDSSPAKERTQRNG